MKSKKIARIKRAKPARAKIASLNVSRLSVHRSSQHMYAQVFSPCGTKVVASASTLDKTLRSGATSNVEAAKKVGQLIADRAKSAGIEVVAFDRGGFKYHGRVKALADAARESGLQF